MQYKGYTHVSYIGRMCYLGHTRVIYMVMADSMSTGSSRALFPIVMYFAPIRGLIFHGEINVYGVWRHNPLYFLQCEFIVQNILDIYLLIYRFTVPFEYRQV